MLGLVRPVREAQAKARLGARSGLGPGRAGKLPPTGHGRRVAQAANGRGSGGGGYAAAVGVGPQGRLGRPRAVGEAARGEVGKLQCKGCMGTFEAGEGGALGQGARVRRVETLGANAATAPHRTAAGATGASCGRGARRATSGGRGRGSGRRGGSWGAAAEPILSASAVAAEEFMLSGWTAAVTG